MDAAVQIIQFYEANYPEYLRRVFVINGEFTTFPLKSIEIYIVFISSDSTESLQLGLRHRQAVPERGNGQ